MERTESKVLSVAPHSENDAIKEMSLFGWNLQGRQEILGPLREAETPNSLLGSIGRSVGEEITGKKTYQYDHYVKLHFVRDLGLPNLPRIKELEQEAHNLPSPENPSLRGPYFILVCGYGGLILGFLMAVTALFLKGTESSGVLAFGLFVALVSVAYIYGGKKWLKSRKQKQQSAQAIREQSQRRAEEIGKELSSLLDLSGLF
jgi:hypothetical protein